jgi:pimeloyl-ACP methyl ester carboxylesterase
MWDYLNLSEVPFQCILIDLPGHGKSELNSPNENPNLNYFASKIEKLLSELDVKEFHVVGHSMGGYIALLLKKNIPHCKKVILLNSNFWEDDVNKKKDRLRVFDIVLKSKDLFIKEAIPGLFFRHNKNDKEVKKLTEEASEMDSLSIAYSTLAMRDRLNNRRVLTDYPNDFLIIQGEKDPLVSPEKMQKELDGLEIEVTIIQNSGHMSHIERPENTRKEILQFLK